MRPTETKCVKPRKRPVFGMEISDYFPGDSVKFTAFGRKLRYTGVVVCVDRDYVTCRIPSGLLFSGSGTEHKVDADNIQLI